MEWQNDDYIISMDKKRIDLFYVHGVLSNSYWANGIPMNIVKRSIEGSLCFSVFHGQTQIGFARVTTDQATFAYLADVFIDPLHRGKGLGKWLIGTIRSYPSLQGLRTWMLGTKDAHGLYNLFGFQALPDPTRFMIIRDPDIYKKHRSP